MKNPTGAIYVATARADDTPGNPAKYVHHHLRLRTGAENQVYHHVGLWAQACKLAAVTTNVFGGQIDFRLATVKHGDGMAHFSEKSHHMRADQTSSAND
jgi:hypothetical protein